MKILVRLPNWLGDVVMSIGFIQKLTEIYPASAIDVIVKEELIDIVSFIPTIRKTYPFSKKKNKGLWGQFIFSKMVARQEKYDLFFSLPESFSSAFIGYFSGAKTRIGYNGEGRSLLLTHPITKTRGAHRVDEYLYLAESFAGVQHAHSSIKLSPKNNNFIKSLDLPNGYIIFNANSEAQSRKLPLEYATTLVDALIANFKRSIVFTGTKADYTFYSSLMDQLTDSGYCLNMAGQTSLKSLVDLMFYSRLVITTDSGPAHIANALNKNLIVLFGAGNEHNTGPYNKENTKILRVSLHCTPCVSNVCRYGIPRCLLSIDTKEVIKHAKVFLEDVNSSFSR